jgi:Zn-dependent protease with chaperone function
MTYLALACCLTLLAYGVVVSAGTLLVLPFVGPVLRTTDPRARSRRLLALRLSPAIVAALVALGLVLQAFLRFEPWSTKERVGTSLILFAAISGGVLVIGILRGSLDLYATRRLVRRWSRDARPIRLPGVTLPAFTVEERFPIVTIAGCAKPRLFLSCEVLERCTRAELAAIIAHESGHLRRGDPWKRLLLRACPDVLGLTPVGVAIEHGWAAAAEQAADDEASAAGTERSIDLASALLKVARLAGTAKPHGLPMTALYRGDGVASRVARLLERHTPLAVAAPGPRVARRAMALVACTLLVLVSAVPGVLHEVHLFLETLVHLLG